LATLEDKQSGAYRSAFAALSFDEAAVDDALQRLHQETFRRWKQRSLAAQTDDVIRYCRTAGKFARDLAARWIRQNDEAASLVPSDVPETERQTHCRNLALALAGAYGRIL
jgi:hypothetical protein